MRKECYKQEENIRLDLPGMADEMRRPMMLLVKARKPV